MTEQEKSQNGYIGVNIRVDRANVADDKQVTRAVNVDFNKELGTASIRNGRYELADLADDVVRLIAKVNGFRYYAAGRNLYRNGVVMDLFPAQLDVGLETDVEAFRPINDLAIWAFIADVGNRERIDSPVAEFSTNSTTGTVTRTATFTGRGHSAMKKDDGTRLQKWGIGEPPAIPAPIQADTILATYIWSVTYLRFDTTNLDNPLAVAHEGNPVTISANFGEPG